jgi:ribA/ribD-fused uncharacterized protein
MKRVWLREGNVVFRKTREKWGGMSNMCAGYPLRIAGITMRTSEALYQALKYPNYPRIQTNILTQKSPMSAKMVGKPHKEKIRADWFDVRETIMLWCLEQKAKQNSKFRDLLKASEGMEIIESSWKDRFWGAVPEGDFLYGSNRLGCLLMKLRDSSTDTKLPSNCKLLGRDI